MAARMEFDVEAESAFRRRRDQLVAEFEEWLPSPVRIVDANDFGMLLDWKWGYDDGHLGRWRKQHLTEFLLEWCPGKLSGPPRSPTTSPPRARP